MSSWALEWAACHRVWQCQFVLCVCVCVVISACPRMRVFLSHLPGGALLTGKAAQLSSLRLGQPLGQSGLLGNPRWSDITAGMQREKHRRGLLPNSQLQTTPVRGSHCILASCWRCEREYGQSNGNCQILDLI